MVDAVEVSIESALLDQLRALTFSPSIPVAWPNVAFTPPDASTGATWLRATFLPADTATLTVDAGSNQHFGILQIDVFQGQGAGELAPVRTAASIIAWFKRGTRLSKNGFVVGMTRAPFRSRMIRDDPWIMIPVSVPYLCFATDPA